jgi:phosphatidylserine/phosphatidylglycerophosphate/cardiolipin synthase-like enzyme
MGLRAWKRIGGGVVLAFAALGLLPVFAPPASGGEVEIHYAPSENLEHVDVGLLRSAHAKIDMAAYSLTDWPVIDALIDARRRGVAVRIVLDPSQQHAFDRLREIAGAIRMKAPGPYMHLKSYAIDGRILRSGSANLSASGLKQQDNDIVVVAFCSQRLRGSLRANMGGRQSAAASRQSVCESRPLPRAKVGNGRN